MSRLRSLCVFLPLAALALVPACARPPAPPPEPEQPAVVLVDPSGSMSVDHDCVPPPRLIPPAAEPGDPAHPDAMEVFAVAAPNDVWQFQYPNGTRARNDLRLPVGRTVKITLVAEKGAVSPAGWRHFEIPAFPLAEHAWPDRFTQAVAKPTRTGTFGLWGARGHVGSVLVVPAEEFDAWLFGSGAPAGKNPAAGTLAFEGRKLFLKLQCINCHSAVPNAKGPLLDGLYGARVNLKGGGAEIADDQYIIESIRKPKAKVVEGWDAIMPAYDESKVSAEELNALVAYVRGLKKPNEDRFPPLAGPPTRPPKESAPPPREK